MLLGWKRVSKPHLWPVALVLLVVWLIINESQWRETETLGDAFHQVLGTQMERFEAMHAAGERLPPMAEAQVEEIGLLIEEAHAAGLDDSRFCTDLALVCFVLGEARPHEDWATAATDYLERATEPTRPGQSGYYPQVSAAIKGTPLAEADRSELQNMLENWPHDWWMVTLAGRLGLDKDRAHREAMLSRGRDGAMNQWAVTILWPAIYGFAIIAVWFVVRRLERSVPAPRYSERMLRVVPAEVMLISYSVVMWLLFIGSGILVAFVSIGLPPAWGWWAWWLVVVGTLLIEPLFMRMSAGLTHSTTVRTLGWDHGDVRSLRNWGFALGCAWVTLSLLDVMVMALGWLGLEGGMTNGLRFVGESSTPASGFAMLVFACVVVPIVEELVYRGMLFRTMRNAWGAVAGSLVSSVIFSAVHFYDVVGTIEVFVYGLVFCLIYQRTGSIAIAAMTHGLVNLTISLSSWLAGW